MFKILGILLIALVSVSTIFAQTGETPRTDLTNETLSPTSRDLVQAEIENAEVFRILPRGIFDSGNNDLSLRGGGAYYSFTKKSHSYNEIPQIELQSNNLIVGFYGANYGLMADLGNVPLYNINENTPEVSALSDYRVKQVEPEARAEFRSLHKGLEIGGVTYKKQVPAIPGNTYVLRAISFNEADTLVAFNVYRKDADGSLIIFWKMIKEFEKPVLIRDDAKLD